MFKLCPPFRVVRGLGTATYEATVEVLDANDRTVLSDQPYYPAELPSEFADVFAAAPDLLEALILALPYVEEAAEDPVNKREAVEALVAKIRAAINKTEGA